MFSSTEEQSLSSPYQEFVREEWKSLNGHFNHNLTSDDIGQLRALNEPLNITEIEEIYFPLAHLLELQIKNHIKLLDDNYRFVRREQQKLACIICIVGSVAVGKGTTARVLRRVLSLLPDKALVELVTTDGFLFPNKVRIERNKLNNKGFP